MARKLSGDHLRRSRLAVRYLAALVLPIVIMHTVHAQGNLVVVRYYHGEVGRSQIISVERSGEAPYTSTTDHLPLVLCEGDEVRIDIMNANPVFYTYGLDVVAKKIEVEKVDLSALSLLSQIPGLPVRLSDKGGDIAAGPEGGEVMRRSRAMMGMVDATIRFDKELDIFIHHLDSLRESLLKASGFVAASDAPEPIDLAPVAGFSHARKEIASMPNVQFTFGSTTLTDDLKNDYQTVLASAADGNDTLLVEALKAYGATLVGLRDEIRDSFAGVGPVVRVSAKVPANGGILTLKVGPNGKTGTRLRSSGELLTIDVRPCYAHPSIDVHPYTFAFYHPNIRRFYIREGKVAMDTVGDFRGGVGSMLRWNFAAWGVQSEWYMSAGLGVGAALGSNEVLGSFQGAVMLNYREFGIGFGVGGALLPVAVHAPARLGEALPADAGPLDDLVESRLRGAWYLIFSVPGLNLPIK